MRLNKFHAVGTRDAEGRYFPSKGEAARARALALMQSAKKISGLTYHPSVEIFPGINWKLDTSYIEDGQQYWEDFKGVMNRDTALKIALWKYFGPGPLRIVKMDRGGLFRVANEYWPKGFTKFLEDFKCAA